MVGLLRRRHPGVPVVMMGESMGGAVLMCLGARPDAPKVEGYVLVSPAVWGRARMNSFMRGSLWLASTLVPGMEISRPPPPVQVFASDNMAALVRLSRDPLTIRSTRMDTLRGLVDLMDAALASAPGFTARALFMQHGAEDELVPKRSHRWPPGAHCRRLQHCLAYYPHGWHLMLRDNGIATLRSARRGCLDPKSCRQPPPPAPTRLGRAWLERSAGLEPRPPFPTPPFARGGFVRYAGVAGPVAQLDRASPSEGRRSHVRTAVSGPPIFRYYVATSTLRKVAVSGPFRIIPTWATHSLFPASARNASAVAGKRSWS